MTRQLTATELEEQLRRLIAAHRYLSSREAYGLEKSNAYYRELRDTMEAGHAN